jgi:glucose/arabinose dehydrogenase
MLLKSPFLKLILLFGIGALFSIACGAGGDDEDEDSNPFGLISRTVASAERPVALTFAPDGRLFFAEQYTGEIRVINSSGSLLDEPFVDIEVANWLNLDWGLTGIALDPNFAANHYLYAFYTEIAEPSDTMPIGRPVLIRYTEQDNRGVDPTVLIDDFPTTRPNHQGFKTNGPIHFGPDGNLYMVMGDYDWNKEGPNGTGAGQDLSIPIGKVLRVNTSGEAAVGNPFEDDSDADQRNYAYGFNDVTPFAFHPETNQIYSTDETGSCEELNIVVSGGNYGWPDVGEFPYSDCFFGDQVKPIFLFSQGDLSPGEFLSGPGVSGLSFLEGTRYPSLGTGLLVCEESTGLMRRLVLSGANFDQVGANDVVVEDCQADVAVAADGTIYYSNQTEVKRLDPPAATTSPASP